MALTAPFDAPMMDPLSKIRSYPVKASTIIYEGAMVGIDSNGEASMVTHASTWLVAGRANETVDNTVDGHYINVQEGVIRYLNGASVTQAAVGSIVYALTDSSITTSATSASIAGVLIKVDATYCWVSMGLEAAIDDTALTTYISDVASTSSGEGASLVGIYDTAQLYAGTDVEAALAEKVAGKRVAVLANAALTPGILVVQTFSIADASSSSTDYVLALKQEIIDVVVQKRSSNGGTGDTITISNNGSAITEAIDININDTLIARNTTINDANSTINASGTLRIAWNKATNVACLVTIYSVLRT